MKLKRLFVLASFAFLIACFQNCSVSKMQAIENLSESSEQNLSRSVASISSSKSIFTNSSVVNSLNSRIDSGEQALDYVIQDVCVDANDNIINGDPAKCLSHRNVRIGEKVPYIVTDVDTRNGNATYQGLFSYPVPGTDNTLKILVSKNMQGQFNSSFNYDYNERRDGFDLLDANGPYISAIRTSDPGCFDQIISSPSGRQNGWIFFAPGGGGGSLNHDIRIERITPSRPAECASVSQSSGNSTQDIWNPPGPMTFESGKTLQAIQTYHVAHWNLSQQNNAIEKYYFTREYGFTRWEAWIPRNRCYAEGKWYCNDPSAYIGGRCAGSGTTTWGNQIWVRVDCRDSTNYIALSNPVLPLKNNMANGDIDANLVLNLKPISSQENGEAIRQLAIDVLGRDSSSLTAAQAQEWWGHIVSSGGSLKDVRNVFATSDETAYRIRQLAIDVLGRDPSLTHIQARDWWASNLVNGMTLTELRKAFASSEEAKNLVKKIYNDFLGRDADTGGLQHHVNLLADGAIVYSNLRIAFANCAELKSKLGGLYQSSLGRLPTDQELSQHRNDLIAGTKTITQITQEIMGALAPLGSWTGNGAGSYHLAGRANGSGWEITADGRFSVLTYGPYVQQLPAGRLKAVFNLMLDNNTANNEPLIDVDVYRYSTNTLFAQMTITRGQFNKAFTLQQFELPFTYDGVGELEFRVSVRGNSYIHHAGTTVWKN